MGILSFLRGDDVRAKAISGTPAVLETMAARQFSPYIALGGTNINSQRIGSAYVKVQNGSYSWLYLYSPPVRRVVDYVARNISQLGLKCYERVSDDEREHRGDHPAAEALRHPNPQTPGNYFVQEFVKCHLVFGNAYALKFRASPDAPLTLVLLNPARVGIVGRSHFAADAYRIYAADGTFFDVPPEDILRWPSTTGDDPRCGESYLETLREALAADVAAQQAVTELHRSGLVFSGWIERPVESPEWSEEARKRFQESWTNQGKDSRRHTPILEEGMAFKQAGVTPEDAQFIASRQLTLDYVASLFGMKNIPPETEDARKQFYADVLPPFCELCCSFFDLGVLQQEYGLDNYYFEFNLDEKLITDDRLKTLISAAGAPIFTRNESRAIVNKPPLPGGDELIVPSNVTDGDPSKPSPMVNPIQDPNKPPQDGSHRSGEAGEPMPAGSRASLNGHSKAPLIPRRRMASERRDRWAKEYQGVLDRHFERQRRSIKSSKTNKAITDDRWNTELGNGLNDVAERQFEVEGAHVAFRLASTFDPNYGENWLAEKSIGAATSINETTQQHADEADLDKAFEQAMVRSAGAAMAYATDVAGFATKVATEQAPGEPTVTIDGGECEVCAPFQGSWPASELESWPAYHPSCSCVADVYSAAPEKSLVVREKAALQVPPVVNVTTPAQTFNFDVRIPEGVIQSHFTVEPSPVTVTAPDVHVDAPEIHSPVAVNIEEGAVSAPIINMEAQPAPEINVHPAEVKIEKGAVESVVNLEAQPAPDINFNKGAFAMSNPVTVEAAAPADVRIEEGAIQMAVSSPDVTVEAPQPPNVNVEVKGGKSKKTVTFSDGKTAEITDELQNKRRVEFSDGRTAEITEEES